MLVFETAIAFFITLGVLVVVHEWGHFIASKLLGVRVEEFAIGFGPKLVTIAKKDDTEYTIRAVPLGGFNKLSGMEPGEDEDDPRGYNAQPIWKRFLIVFAGPFMSFLLAYVIFCAMGTTIGLPSDVQNKVKAVNPGSPAAKAGLKPGDRVIAINGEKIRHGQDLQEIVFKSAGKELTLQIQRDSKVLDVKATPELKELEGKKVGLMGVQLTASETQKYGFTGSIIRGTQMTVFLVQETLDTLTTKSKLKRVGGIIAIARATAETIKYGVYALFLQGAMLSLTLAILNLFPWPILDGGHILLLGLEAVRRKKLTPEQMQVFQTIGLATLLALVGILFYIDIAKWVAGTPVGQ
ncbi:MAG: M50 family metallopeptidase [Armatimonadota bacterium]|nr:M50 family metallopeptidase [Armatimonadota bacterium]